MRKSAIPDLGLFERLELVDDVEVDMGSLLGVVSSSDPVF
jgi:hypothetical protein